MDKKRIRELIYLLEEAGSKKARMKYAAALRELLRPVLEEAS